MIRTATLFCAAALLAGCVASNPKNIQAVAVPAVSFAHLSCDQLATEDARITEEIGYMSFRQNNRRTTDVVGVLAIGVSPSGIGQADWELQISQAKGIKDAINTAMTNKGCAQDPAEIEDSREAKIRWHRRARGD
jgi:hypothetical protein